MIFKNVNIKIEANSNIALMGNSGSGKETIGKLIANYYGVKKGRILVNGIEIQQYTKESLTNQILYIPQKVELFSGTILENILLGRDIDKEKVFKISRCIGFDEIVNQFSKGYNTIIGERGIMLSAGQMQMLNIIRATVQNYNIIIFDEVTNGLDFELKEKVCNYLFGYGNMKLFITHDYEFAKKCDDIYILKNQTIMHS